MKKVLINIMVLCMVLLTTQCRKKGIEPGNGGSYAEEVYITVTADNGGSKADIDELGRLTWESGDLLWVVSPSTDSILGSITLESGAGTNKGVFSGKIKNWTTTERLKLYYHYSKMLPTTTAGYRLPIDITDQTEGTLEDIKSNFEILYGETREMAPGTDNIGPVTLKPLISIAVFDTKTSSGFDVDENITCYTYCKASLNLQTGKFTNMVSGAVSMPKPSEKCYMVLLPGTKTLTFTQTNSVIPMHKSFAGGKFYTAHGKPIMLIKLPAGVLPGEFSVSSAQKVYFSQGNLQYEGSTSNWKFADHQYDYIGGTTGTGQGSAATDVNRDLFGWGTTGTVDLRCYSVLDWYQTNYQPYSTAASTDGNPLNPTGYGPDYGGLCNLSCEYQSDWGWLKISNGGNQENGGWRTLTNAEYNYLLITRTPESFGMTANARFAKVKVNGVNGLLLFPDWFAWDTTVMGKAPLTVNAAGAEYPTENYTSGEFAEMEHNGAVFLPAAGYRKGTTMNDVGTYGCYWSMSAASASEAKALKFTNGAMTPQSTETRYNGFSVRLVMNSSQIGGDNEDFEDDDITW